MGRSNRQKNILFATFLFSYIVGNHCLCNNMSDSMLTRWNGNWNSASSSYSVWIKSEGSSKSASSSSWKWTSSSSIHRSSNALTVSGSGQEYYSYLFWQKITVTIDYPSHLQPVGSVCQKEQIWTMGLFYLQKNPSVTTTVSLVHLQLSL